MSNRKGETDRMPITALKEWAVSVDALLEGKQIVVMRKGGIAEETRDFRLITDGFCLLPAYEHQKAHLLKPEYAGMLERTLREWSPEQERIRIRGYAEAVLDIEVTDRETLDKLRDLHIWTDEFAEERLKWKRKNPLHVLLLRVYRLEEELSVPTIPAYTGCKSWVQLEDGPQLPSMKPVLTDAEFDAAVQSVKTALAR